MTEERTVRLDAIEIDGSVQVRVETRPSTVEDYAESMRGGEIFPPVVLFEDENGTLWIADGWHRIRAALAAKLEEIAAIIHVGNKHASLEFAVNARKNNKNGEERFTNADKRRLIEVVAKDEVWSSWSDNAIAKLCGVHHTTVNTVRSSLANLASDERTYTDKHGNVSTIKTGNIGKSQPQPVEETEEVDLEAAVDAGTPDHTEYDEEAPLPVQTTPPVTIPTRSVADPTLCDRCNRVGAVKNCPECKKIATEPPKRKPIDEGKKNGQIVFDGRKVDAMFGTLIRSIDDWAAVFGRDSHYQRLRLKAREWIEAWEDWKKAREAKR